MRKGITPIISIIILLLIVVALAASAWTYISNYTSGLTGKVIEIPTQQCVNGEEGLLLFRNIGTNTINIAADIMIMDNNGAVVAATWNTSNGTGPITSIPAGGYARASEIQCCTTGTDCPKTCNFDVIVGGRSQKVTIQCQGA